MAQAYNTGPVHIYWQLFSLQMAYLGTCERAPRIVHTAYFEPIFNDIAGTKVPYDELFQGKDASIAGDLTRWNEAVLKDAETRVGNGAQVQPDGLDDEQSRGTMMLAEGQAGILILHFPYYAKPVMSAAGMRPGYRYFGAWLAGPDDKTLGTQVNKAHIQFRALPVYQYTTGKFLLYDTNLSGIPAVPPNTVTGQ